MDSVGIDKILVWINTEENRTGVARWASSLGGDEKKIKSTLDEYHRQLGVESIDILTFFKRDEVPGLFDREEMEVAGAIKQQEKTYIRITGADKGLISEVLDCVRGSQPEVKTSFEGEKPTVFLGATHFWINSDHCRMTLALWATSLGGDEQRVLSMLEQAHREGIEYIAPKEFFTREDIPGLFEEDQ